MVLGIIWKVRKMVKKSDQASCSGPTRERMSCFKVETLISVDECGSDGASQRDKR